MKKLLLPVAIATILTPAVLAADAEQDLIKYHALLPSIETMVVVSSRNETSLRELATSVAVLDEAQIEALGFQSLADVLRVMPSVTVSNAGGLGKASSISIRGEEGYRTMVRVDGVDVSDPTGPQANAQIQHLLNANVARVEILRGAQGMMYGADAGGVLNISTDSITEGMQGDVNVEVGSLDSQRRSASVGGGGDLGDYYVSAAHVRTDGFNAYIPDNVYADDDGYRNTTYHGRIGWNISESLRLEAVVRDTDSDTEFDSCGYPVTVHDCADSFEQQNARLSLTHSSERFNHEIAYSTTSVDRINFTEGLPTYIVDGKVSKLEINGDAYLSDAHQFVYGFELRTDTVRENERDQQSLYVEYQGAYAEQFYVTAGVRQDDNDDFGENTSYRLSGAFLLPSIESGTLKLKASFGTGFRAPSLSEVDYNEFQITSGFATTESLPALKQENSEGLDVGIEYFSNNQLHLEAVWFDQKITDEIYFDLVDFVYLQGSQESQSQGVELIADIPVTDIVVANINYTYIDANADAGSPRSRKPKHMGNIGVHITPSELLTVSAHMRLAQGAVDTYSNIKLDDYEVFDASIRYQLAENVTIYIRGENLADESYSEVPDYRATERTFYAGFDVTL